MYQTSHKSWFPNLLQRGLPRSLSDHNAIIIGEKVEDWGPKPFKVYDGWLMNKQFQKVVRDCWLDYQPMGWGGYALKCKLQHLKQRLKIWSKDNIGDLCSKVKQLQQKLNDLENSIPAQPSEQQVKELFHWIVSRQTQTITIPPTPYLINNCFQFQC